MDEFVKMLDGVKRSLQVLRSKEDTEEGRQGNTDVAECDSFPPRSKNLLQVAIFMGESHGKNTTFSISLAHMIDLSSLSFPTSAQREHAKPRSTSLRRRKLNFELKPFYIRFVPIVENPWLHAPPLRHLDIWDEWE
eukprot:c9476_g1_i1 orf=1-405(-)